MIIKREISNLYDFEPWDGAIENYNLLIQQGYAETFFDVLEELFPNGLTETEVNDLLWFDTEFLEEFFPER